MTEFIDNACSMYEELGGRKLKPASSPYVPEGSLTDDDWDNRGSLSKEASRVVMKILWGARLSPRFDEGHCRSYQEIDGGDKNRRQKASPPA